MHTGGEAEPLTPAALDQVWLRGERFVPPWLSGDTEHTSSLLGQSVGGLVKIFGFYLFGV